MNQLFRSLLLKRFLDRLPEEIADCLLGRLEHQDGGRVKAKGLLRILAAPVEGGRSGVLKLIKPRNRHGVQAATLALKHHIHG